MWTCVRVSLLLLDVALLGLMVAVWSAGGSCAQSPFATSSPSQCIPPYSISVLPELLTVSFSEPTAAGVVWSLNSTLLAGQPYQMQGGLAWTSEGHPLTTGECSCSYQFHGESSQSCGSVKSTVPPPDPAAYGGYMFDMTIASTASGDSFVGVGWSMQVSCYYGPYDVTHGFQLWSLADFNLIMVDYPAVYDEDLPTCPSAPSTTSPSTSTTSSAINTRSSSSSSSTGAALCVPPFAVSVPSEPLTMDFPASAAGVVWTGDFTLLAGQAYLVEGGLAWNAYGHPVSTGQCSCSYQFDGESLSCGSLQSTVPPVVLSISGAYEFDLTITSNWSGNGFAGVDFSMQVSCYYGPYDVSHGLQVWSLYDFQLTMLYPPFVYEEPGVPPCPPTASPSTSTTSSAINTRSSSSSSSTGAALCVPPFAVSVPSEPLTMDFPASAAGVVWTGDFTLLAGQAYLVEGGLAWNAYGHPVSTGQCSCSYQFDGESLSCGSLQSTVPPVVLSISGAYEFDLTITSNWSGNGFAGVDFSMQVSCYYGPYDVSHGLQVWSLYDFQLTMLYPPFVYEEPGVPPCPPTASPSTSTTSSSAVNLRSFSLSSSSAPSSTGAAAAYSDPRFVGFWGQSFFVGGRAGGVYNLLSDADVQANAHFVQLSNVTCPLVDGRAAERCYVEAGTYFGVLSVMVRGGAYVRITGGGHDEGFHSVRIQDQISIEVGDSWDGAAMGHGEEGQGVVEAKGAQRLLLGRKGGAANADSGEHSPTSPTFTVHRPSHRLLHIRAGVYELQVVNMDQYVDVATLDVSCWQCVVEQLRPEGLLGQTWNATASVKHSEDEVEQYRERDDHLLGCKHRHDRFCSAQHSKQQQQH